MVDSKHLITLPPGIRFLLVSLLVLVFGGSTWLVVTSVGKSGFRDWVLIAMAIVQMSATGLVLAVVFFFGEADVGVLALRAKTQRWLTKILPESLGAISNSAAQPMRVVSTSGVKDVFGCQYELQPIRIGVEQSVQQGIKLWVGLNVNRLVVIYWIRCDDISSLKQCFEPTFKGAESVGWAPANFQVEQLNSSNICSIWTSWMVGADGFLKNPEKQLFAAQDIAMMTQSVLRTAERRGLSVCLDQSPRPL